MRRNLHIDFLPALVLLIFWSTVSNVLAQEVSVQATVPETTVGTEETVNYRIEVSGVSGNDVTYPRAPEATGLALLQSVPSTQQRVSMM